MTRDEILAMEAGRKLDALVAEKVMGWNVKQIQLVQIPSTKEEALEWGWEEHTEDNYDWRRGFNLGTISEPISLHRPIEWDFYRLPKYSTNIAPAWEVVEKVRSNGYMVTVATALEDDCWSANLASYELGWAMWLAYGPTAPLAICRAALLAVMEAE